MSKIIAFSGSPRTDGFTNQLINEVIRGAKSCGVETKFYDLNDKGVSGCQGCYSCRTKEGCAIKDDTLAPMYEDIKAADALIFGSPIYFYQVTGQAKIWLDRLFPMVTADFKPRYPGKKIASIFVQGAVDNGTNSDVIRSFNGFFSVFGWEISSTLLCTDTSLKNYKIPEELMQKAYSAGVKLTE